jgi:hypothetical protein
VTDGTALDVEAGDAQDQVANGLRLVGAEAVASRGRGTERALPVPAVGEQANVADTDEGVGDNVEQEATEKFVNVELHARSRRGSLVAPRREAGGPRCQAQILPIGKPARDPPLIAAIDMCSYFGLTWRGHWRREHLSFHQRCSDHQAIPRLRYRALIDPVKHCNFECACVARVRRCPKRSAQTERSESRRCDATTRKS